ncbi:DUF2505 domain-containing protein [Mycobacterium sp. E802]|uniref:DUF2505 domain-containing protein n=1 Tax=Mycobacterium sp. E802 TaxID=1834152 RepID=UPI0009EDC353|nr:DUF2505 domain-containing protein [Mycobacterium sp. E802]
MSRSFDFSVDSRAQVEQILSAFGERDYWLDRMSRFGGLDTLASLSVEPDGTVTAVMVKDVRRGQERSPIAKFLPVQWRVVQQERWQPVGERRIRGELSVTPHGTPAYAAGTALLMPTAAGSRIRCVATVEFKAPLLGQHVEKIMGRMLTQNVTALQDFTAEWIDVHS